MPQAELRVVSGKQAGSSVVLPTGKFLIGREHDCHLRPNSDSISRHHCVFTVDEYSVRLRDLGSTNGTFVNGERLRGAVELKAGDRVTVGKLDFQVVIDGEPSVIIAPGTVVAAGTETLSAVAAAPASDNSTEFAVVAPAAVASDTGPDTAMINTGDSVEFAPPAVAQTREFAMPVAPVGAPQFAPQQAWGVPPQGVPPQYAYPPGYPGQFPPMPYGYGYPYPGVPQPMPPGYGYPQPMAPPQAPVPPTADAGTKKPEVDVKLPDPTTTGAKAPAPKPEAPAGGAPAGGAKHVPSAAKDIINSYLQRKPKT